MTASSPADMLTPPHGTDLRTAHRERRDELSDHAGRTLWVGVTALIVVILGGGAGGLYIANHGAHSALVGFLTAVLAAALIVVVLVVAVSGVRAADQDAADHVHAHDAELHQARQQAAALQRKLEARVNAGHGDGQLLAGGQRVMFVKLARRLQSLISRCIAKLDELENNHDDPELLAGLFGVDHQITLARRQTENLAVLGGEAPERRSTVPVQLHGLLLGAASEVERYEMIALAPTESVELHGHGAAEIVHLLAELLDNATQFAPPAGSKVEVRCSAVAAGLAIEVVDRGIGMPLDDLYRSNQLLSGVDNEELERLLDDGRIGLAVVRELARRHGLRVQLDLNIYGGVTAVVVIPPALLVRPAGPGEHAAAPGRRRLTWGGDRPVSGPTADGGAQAVAPRAAQRPSGPAAPDTANGDVPAVSALDRAQGWPASRAQRRPHPAALAPGHDAAAAELPPLPLRSPGESFGALAAGGVDGGVVGEPPRTDLFQPDPLGSDHVEDRSGTATPGPPRLPVRTGSYMPDTLRQAASHTSPAAVPGHDPHLFADVVRGRADAHLGAPMPAEPPEAPHLSNTAVAGTDPADTAPPGSPPPVRPYTRQGDDPRWPPTT